MNASLCVVARIVTSTAVTDVPTGVGAIKTSWCWTAGLSGAADTSIFLRISADTLPIQTLLVFSAALPTGPTILLVTLKIHAGVVAAALPSRADLGPAELTVRAAFAIVTQAITDGTAGTAVV